MGDPNHGCHDSRQRRQRLASLGIPRRTANFGLPQGALLASLNNASVSDDGAGSGNVASSTRADATPMVGVDNDALRQDGGCSPHTPRSAHTLLAGGDGISIRDGARGGDSADGDGARGDNSTHHHDDSRGTGVDVEKYVVARCNT